MNNDEIRKALFGDSPAPPKRPGTLLDLFGSANSRPMPLVKITKRKVFVSFDFENDRHYKRLLEAWSANAKFLFTFQDKTPQEIQTESVARVKGVLTTKVQEASHVLVLAGRYANQRHADAQEIGCINWINFECQQAMLYKKKIVVVLLEQGNVIPQNLIGYPGIRVDRFNQSEIISALDRA